MRAKVYAVVCAVAFVIGLSGECAEAGCFAGYGHGRSLCYRASTVHGPPTRSERAFEESAYAYYPPVERQQLVQPYEFSHSGWDIFSTYGWDAYAAAYAPDAYAPVGPGCFMSVPVFDGRGGWDWGMRAGCF